MNTIEIALGHVSDRGVFIPKEELKWYLEEKKELYRSLFLLEETKVNSIAKYEGKFGADSIIYDIDIQDGTGYTCLTHAKRFYEFLIKEKVNPELIMIWFSGRGFHIEIPNLYGFDNETDTPIVVKRSIDKHLKKKVTYDSIYDRGRLIRVPFSFNEKSELYKIPLDSEELFTLSYEDICKEAEIFCEKSRVEYYNDAVEKINRASFETIFSKYVVSHEKIAKEIVSDKPINGEALNGNVTCVQKMVKDPNKVGRRHHLLLRMISAWRRMGLSRQMSLNNGSVAIPSLKHKEIEDIVNNTYDNNYQYACTDPYMSEYCDPMCKYFIHKDYGTEVKDVNQMWTDYVENINKGLENISFNLKDVWDIKTDYRFCEGELAVIIGDTKLGKTALLQNLVIPLTHMRVLYLTLEVGLDLMLRRFVQIANGMSKEETIKAALSHNSDKAKEILAPLKHIYCRQSAPELNSIKELISEVQPKIVVIDTLDCINVKYSNDPFVKMEKITMKLKEIAHQNNIIIIAISHIGKNASEEGILDVHSAKGNSVIEQKADKIIGIEGSLLGNMNRTVKSLASRDESGFKLSFIFDPVTFKFNQIKEVANVGFKKT
tara:strand:- start:7353 stop:9158 length:1806 start_codon:yes stop_codon:yes gene_type:complete